MVLLRCKIGLQLVQPGPQQALKGQTGGKKHSTKVKAVNATQSKAKNTLKSLLLNNTILYTKTLN
jgi:hypothetical protein